MRKNHLLIIVSVAYYSFLTSAQDCTGGRYTTPIFTEIEQILDVQYGVNIGHDGITEEILSADIYAPKNDDISQRPLIILAHGGSFVNGDKMDLALQCSYYASMGYVAASIKYRLINDGSDPELLLNMGLAFKKGLVRASHDMRAAIRFFRKSVLEENNPYGINPNIIIVGGVSAGAILANHVTYLDKESKITPELDAYFVSQGGLEGNSGNSGYSSVPKMTVSICGAIMDTSWIEHGSQPYIGIHNVGDIIVPNLEGQPDFGGFVIPLTLQGDSLMYKRTLTVGVSSAYKSYPGDGHCDFTLDWQNFVNQFLYDQICNQNLSVGETDLLDLFAVYPNPTENIFHIETNYKSAWTINITDISGKEVFYKKSDKSKIQIDATNLNAGIYFLNLTTNKGERISKKIVVL